jgi:FdhD protein
VQVDWETGSVVVKTRAGLKDLAKKTAKRTKTTGCGQGTVFGDLMAGDRPRQAAAGRDAHARGALRPARPRARARDDLQAGRRGARLRARAERPERAEILMFVEDVGRHNAVDAIAGRMWLDGLDGGDKIFYTTGRLTSEMVIKCAQMGIPFLVSRSGLTQMGHDIAQKVGMTMIGRATNKHYLLFTGAERFVG